MASIVFRQAAIDDLNDIWNYTVEEWSEKQADRYYASIKFACTQIGINPELGEEYEEIKSNVYGLRTGKHIIFYQIISEQEIEILRILHERMDLITRMSK